MGDTATGQVDLRAWVGRTEQASDVLSPTPARALALTLDQPDLDVADGTRLPELWHWLYFLPLVPTSGLGDDGHPARGGFLPPVPLERRMWAGGRLRFHRDLHVGQTVTKTSEITSVEPKEGRAGPMVFVTVLHTLSSTHGVAVVEEQDIVYVSRPDSYVPPRVDPLPDGLTWTEHQRVDPVLLFRFSALTFNAHRIHYDRPYAVDAEHYPGLVVHGPLQAVLLMESARHQHPDLAVASYEFRASRPLFDFDRCLIAGRPADDGGVDVFTANAEDAIAMRAHVRWR